MIPAKKLERLVKGAPRQMKNSSTYQIILNEGREEQKIITTRELLLRFAVKRLGAPSEATRAKLEAITDVTALVNLHDRIESVESWDELLTTL